MKGKVMMVLALVMGLFTTYLFYQYTKDIQVTQAKQGNMVEVVVAKETIGKNQRIDQDDLQIIDKPEGGLHQNALQSMEGLQGKFANAQIAKGEPILSHRLQTKKEEDLVLGKKIAEGKRALTLGVNIVQSVGNMIEPEDYVDVYVTTKEQIGEKEEFKTNIIDKKVRVLAIGRKMVESTSKEDYVEYSNVTLEVNSNEVADMVKASEEGNIHMVLHSRLLSESNQQEN